MSKILISNKIVDDALNYGYKYVENNQFKKGVKYLEFALQTVPKDQYLLYALIVSYYNMGNMARVRALLKEINTLEIDNLIIQDAVEQIIEELNTKDLLINQKPIPKNVLTDVENLKILQTRFKLKPGELSWIAENSKDPVYKFISEPNFEDDNYKIFEKQYSYFLNSLIKCEKFQNYYNKSKEYNELKLYIYYNASLKTIGHSAFIIKISKDNFLKTFLKDEKVSDYIKNEIIYDLNVFLKKKYLNEEDLKGLVNKSLLKLDLNNFKDKISKIENSLAKTPLYKDPKLFNYAMSIIVKFLRTHVNKFEQFENNEIENKVLEYFYFSNIQISENLKNYINDNYKIDKESYNSTIKELNKISLIL